MLVLSVLNPGYVLLIIQVPFEGSISCPAWNCRIKVWNDYVKGPLIGWFFRECTWFVTLVSQCGCEYSGRAELYLVQYKLPSTGRRRQLSLPPTPTSHLHVAQRMMDSQSQTPPKGLRRLFMSKKDSPRPDKSTESSGSHKAEGDLDTARTIARHQKACGLLRSCLPKAQLDDAWNFLDFSQLESYDGAFDNQLVQQVNQTLESKRGPIKDGTTWSKCCQTVECIIAALIPFSKNFLTIITAGQSVRAFSSFPEANM